MAKTGLTDRQRQIVDQAIEINAGEGLGSMTMRRLSKGLGVSEPALYRHFENKNAILMAMLSVLEEETYDRLPFGEETTPQVLKDHFARLFALFSERPSLTGVVFIDEFADEDPALQARVRSLLAKNHSRLANALAVISMPNGGEGRPDAESLSTLLLGGVRFLVRQWLLDQCSWDLTARGQTLVSTLVGLLRCETQ